MRCALGIAALQKECRTCRNNIRIPNALPRGYPTMPWKMSKKGKIFFFRRLIGHAAAHFVPPPLLSRSQIWGRFFAGFFSVSSPPPARSCALIAVPGLEPAGLGAPAF